ncbi:MAG: hypothetical protein ACPG73_01860 [Candidatus Poseidoniaceae archaeon]
MGLRKRDKKANDLPPMPGLPPMPAPPAPGMPMPPAPGLPLPPNPAAPMPPAPAQIPTPSTPSAPPVAPLPAAPLPPAPQTSPEPQLQAIEALPPSPAPEPVVEEPEKESYAGLYAKKSGKPLQQVYGHIDRIGEGEVGSLLERYSDRFGHELDREIIVMRKDEREDKIAEIRDSPTVQLLNEEAEEESHLDGETLVELNSQLQTVEDELRRLKPEYQAAKDDGDRETLRELRPALEQLMAERKLIKAVLAGEAELDDLIGSEDEEEDAEEYEDEEEEYEDEDAEEDVFTEFVSIIDGFLGELPEADVIAFTKSAEFEIYKSVASNPVAADDDDRSEFFGVVDRLLGDMPDDAILKFTQSEDFEIYRAVGAMYS